MSSILSYVNPTPDSPWGTYLSQVDRVIPYLGHLARWAETLKRPKRALIVDVPIAPTLPVVTRRSKASSDSSIGVSSTGAWTW